MVTSVIVGQDPPKEYITVYVSTIDAERSIAPVVASIANPLADEKDPPAIPVMCATGSVPVVYKCLYHSCDCVVDANYSHVIFACLGRIIIAIGIWIGPGPKNPACQTLQLYHRSDRL